MENNKITISLTTVIIIAVTIGALIFGIISFVIYNNITKHNDTRLAKTQNTTQELSSSNSNKSTSDSFSDNESDNDSTTINNESDDDSSTINNDSDDDSTTIDSESKDNNTDSENTSSITNDNNSNKQDSSSSQAGSITGKASSKSNPLSIGEWGIASKYSSKNSVDVPVKVTNVTRGSSAAQEVKDYCNNKSSFYKYTEPKDGMEWAVVDYTVDLTNIADFGSGEKSLSVTSKISGTGDNTSIKYNGITYIVTTMNINARTSTENIANGQFAVQLPIGCSDYIIVLGDYSQTQAFFKGK